MIIGTPRPEIHACLSARYGEIPAQGHHSREIKRGGSPETVMTEPNEISHSAGNEMSRNDVGEPTGQILEALNLVDRLRLERKVKELKGQEII